MREIKFRAWTGSEMEYRVVVGQLGAFYVEGIDPEDSACMSSANTKYSEQTPIMQFTGLKDRNGKEIYEGDVISVMGSDCNKCPAKNDDGGCDALECPIIETVRDVVTMNRFPQYWLENESSGYEGEGFVSPVYCIVIGNIYENPELLSKEKV